MIEAVELRHEQLLASGAAFQVLVSPPEVVLWSPAVPALYTVEVRLLVAGHTVAAATRRTGFRQLAAQGEQLLLNGEPICLRGALSWGWNPAVIAPNYTADQARTELRTLRAMGFNLVKLCLFIPNQAYYDASGAIPDAAFGDHHHVNKYGQHLMCRHLAEVLLPDAFASWRRPTTNGVARSDANDAVK